jgi:hypothetical protein
MTSKPRLLGGQCHPFSWDYPFCLSQAFQTPPTSGPASSMPGRLPIKASSLWTKTAVPIRNVCRNCSHFPLPSRWGSILILFSSSLEEIHLNFQITVDSQHEPSNLKMWKIHRCNCEAEQQLIYCTRRAFASLRYLSYSEMMKSVHWCGFTWDNLCDTRECVTKDYRLHVCSMHADIKIS